jgi:hypothetical protein
MLQYLSREPPYVNGTVLSGEPAYVNVKVLNGEPPYVNVTVLSGEPEYVNVTLLYWRTSIPQFYSTGLELTITITRL